MDIADLIEKVKNQPPYKKLDWKSLVKVAEKFDHKEGTVYRLDTIQSEICVIENALEGIKLLLKSLSKDS